MARRAVGAVAGVEGVDEAEMVRPDRAVARVEGKTGVAETKAMMRESGEKCRRGHGGCEIRKEICEVKEGEELR